MRQLIGAKVRFEGAVEDTSPEVWVNTYHKMVANIDKCLADARKVDHEAWMIQKLLILLLREKRDRAINEVGGWKGREKDGVVSRLEEEYFNDKYSVTKTYEEIEAEGSSDIGHV
jgi:hypothetical protein